MPRVTPAHEQQRREQILAAALACFARQGYRATSMDDVVRESGLSVGAIYTYFPSKEDLFLALADNRSQQVLAYLNQLFRRPGPMTAKAQQAVDFFFDQLSDDLAPLTRVGVEFWSEAATSERLHARQLQRFQSIRQFFHWLLSEGQRQGEVRSDLDLPAAAELMLALNEGILMLHVAGMRAVAVEALKAAYTAFLNNALGVPARPLLAEPSAAAAPGHRNGSAPGR